MIELRKAIARLNASKAELARLESEVEAEKATISELVESTIPQILDEMGLDSCTADDGTRVTLATDVRCSLPKDARRDIAFSWLEANGFGHLVKQRFTIQFGKDQERWANQFAATLDPSLPCERSKDIHFQTLKAFITEQLNEGAEIPLELFNGHIQRIAKVTKK